MLDEKDIQIISQLLAQQKSEIMGEVRHEVNLLMETYFDPKFNALADGLELLKERTVNQEDVEEAADRIDVLEAVVKVHSREIEKLKKFNHIA